MTGRKINRSHKQPGRPVMLDMQDCHTCSFTEFYPFCLQLYYFSTFKDFNTLAQA